MKWLGAILLLLPITGDPVEVDLWKITGIDYEMGGDLPQWIQDLDGEEVRISGFMYKGTPAQDVDRFFLVTDTCGCNGRIKIHHFVEVTLVDETTNYQTKMISLTGTMSVGEVKEDDYVVSLYRLEADKIE